MAIIYALTHSLSGRSYVGYTKNPPKRFREHRNLLKRGAHSETELQALWTKDGELSFAMIKLQDVADDATVAEKRRAEKSWMDTVKDHGLLLNKRLKSFELLPDEMQMGVVRSAEMRRGTRQTAESNLKRSVALKGKPKGHGAKISATKRRLGQRPTLEAARRGGIAACKKKWARTEEIV